MQSTKKTPANPSVGKEEIVKEVMENLEHGEMVNRIETSIKEEIRKDFLTINIELIENITEDIKKEIKHDIENENR